MNAFSELIWIFLGIVTATWQTLRSFQVVRFAVGGEREWLINCPTPSSQQPSTRELHTRGRFSRNKGNGLSPFFVVINKTAKRWIGMFSFPFLLSQWLSWPIIYHKKISKGEPPKAATLCVTILRKLWLWCSSRSLSIVVIHGKLYALSMSLITLQMGWLVRASSILNERSALPS